MHNLYHSQSFPADRTKIRSVLGGWLYAYETPGPPPVPPTTRSESPDEIHHRRKLKQLRRERTLSMKKIGLEKEKASKARARRDMRKRLEEEERQRKEGKCYIGLRYSVPNPLSLSLSHSVTEHGGSVEPATANESPDAQVPSINRTDPTTNLQQPPSDVQQHTSDMGQHTSDMGQPPSDMGQPPSDTQLPPSDIQAPPSDTTQRLSPGKQQSLSEPSVATAGMQEPQTDQHQPAGKESNQKLLRPDESDPRNLEDSDERSDRIAEKLLKEKKVTAAPPPDTPLGLGEQFIFTMHRKTVR